LAELNQELFDKLFGAATCNSWRIAKN
jgi:hypothetical protein